MMKRVFLICCMIFSLTHAEVRVNGVYECFLPMTFFTLGSQGFLMLGVLGPKEAKKMIVENKLKAAGYITLQSALFYGYSVSLINAMNKNNNEL